MLKMRVSFAKFLLFVGLLSVFKLVSAISTEQCMLCKLQHRRDVCELYGRESWMISLDNGVYKCVYTGGREEDAKLADGDIKLPKSMKALGINTVSKYVDFVNNQRRQQQQQQQRDAACAPNCQMGWVDPEYVTWTDARVPYVLDETSFTKDGIRIIEKAISEIEDNTCVTFVKRLERFARAAGTPYVKIVSGKGCWSYVGMQNDPIPQELSLGKGCVTHGHVLHELMHVLGFLHEHSRPDRDSHIEIMWDNVDIERVNNFDKAEIIEGFKHVDVGYDYNSITHYKSNAFAQYPWLNTIVAKNNDGSKNESVKLGQREHLSIKDVLEINLLYKCHMPTPSTTTPKQPKTAVPQFEVGHNRLPIRRSTSDLFQHRTKPPPSFCKDRNSNCNMMTPELCTAFRVLRHVVCRKTCATLVHDAKCAPRYYDTPQVLFDDYGSED